MIFAIAEVFESWYLFSLRVSNVGSFDTEFSLELEIINFLFVFKHCSNKIVILFMKLFPRISEQHFGYLIPDLEDREFIQKFFTKVFYLFIVLDAFFNEHHNFFMIVVDIVMLEDLAFSVIA